MNFKNSSMRNDLLLAAHQILREEGIDAITIKHLSNKTNVVPGTIYNYFSSKDEILLALATEYWLQAIETIQLHHSSSFVDCVNYMLHTLKENMDQQGKVLMDHVQSSKKRGAIRLNETYQQLKDSLIQQLQKDEHVCIQWDEHYSQKVFVDFVLNNVLIIVNQEDDGNFFKQLLTQVLYK